jgi:hypothetical protein
VPPTGSTRVAAVIGDPIAHSLSPVIFNAAFEAADLDWVFIALRVAAGDTRRAFDGVRATGIRGLSVTMPHKDAAGALVDELTPEASALGAVNCVENRDGTLVALTYGEVSSVAVDPIEKKPVFHYFPGTNALSIGSVGCTMRCEHCQNWQISRSKPDADGVAEGLHHVEPRTVVDLAEKYGCLGVAFTYNEPVIWIE